MTDRQRVYTEVLRTLKSLLKGEKQGHIVTLAMMITGIVIGKKAQLSVMSSEVPYPIKDASIEKRMHRFVKNARIKVSIYYMPFAAAIVASLAHLPLVLAMDGSQVGRGCMTLMVGVIYKQRALPLAWIVYKGKKGHTTAARHIEVLELVRPLIPKGTEVILLGDGEYDNVEMLAWLGDNTDWHFVVRTARSSIIQFGGREFPIECIPAVLDHCRYLPDAHFTQAGFGPLTAMIWWERGHEEPIYLISSLSDAELACQYYKKRYRLETLFSDQKSRGFHIHKSHLSDPQRLSRLLLAACLTFIWTIYLGLDVINQGLRGLIDRTHRRDKSLFRLGLDWLKYQLKYGYPISVCFSIPPEFNLLEKSVR